MKKVLAQINHYFVPHSSNNQKARLLQPSFLSLLVAFFLTAQFFLNYFSFYYPQVLGYAANISPEKVIELTNQERTKKGLAPLKNNSLLNEAAQQKGGDMFALDYWAHNSPTGRTPWTFFKESGYVYVFAGENLARDFNDSEAVIRAWMDSPTHRDNILNNQYQEIGLAVVNGNLQGVETTLIVQLFGTPTPAAPSPPEKETIVSQETTVPQAVLATSEATIPAQSTGLAAAVEEEPQSPSPSLLSPFSVTKILVVGLTSLLIGLLVLDLYLVSRKKIARLSSRSLAHLTFLLFVALIIFVTQQGLVI